MRRELKWGEDMAVGTRSWLGCGRGMRGSGSRSEREVGQVYKPYDPTISGMIILSGPLLLKVP